MTIPREWQFALVLYVLFPLFSGFVSAMQGSGRTSSWPLEYRFAYYLPLALFVMASCGIVCHFLSRPARALKFPLWLLLIIGVLLAGELIKLYVRFIVPIFDKLLPSTATAGRAVEFTFATNFQSGLPTIITWVSLNLAAYYFLRIDRFGYPAPKRGSGPGLFDVAGDETGPRSPRPTFLKRANLVSIDQVRAIEAQQHYINIHGPHGPRTVLYRFSDAIDELGEQNGIRVHRSWWVNRNAVTEVADEDNRLVLLLEDGLRVPVSRTYHLRAMETFVDRTPDA